MFRRSFLSLVALDVFAFWYVSVSCSFVELAVAVRALKAKF